MHTYFIKKFSVILPKITFSTYTKKYFFPPQYSVTKNFVDNAFLKLFNSKDDEVVKMIDDSPYRYNVPLQKFKVEILRRKIIQYFFNEAEDNSVNFPLKNDIENEKQTLIYIQKQLKSSYQPVLPLATSFQRIDESLKSRVEKYPFKKGEQKNLFELGCYSACQQIFPINFGEPIVHLEESKEQYNLTKFASPLLSPNLSTNHFRPVVKKQDPEFEKTNELPEDFVRDLYKVIHCSQPKYKISTFINNSPYVENIPLQKLKVNYLRMYLPDLLREKVRNLYCIQSHEKKLSAGEKLELIPLSNQEQFLLQEEKWDEFIDATFMSNWQHDLPSLHKRGIAIENSLKKHMEDESQSLEFICHQEKNIYIPFIPLVNAKTDQKKMWKNIRENTKKLETQLTLGEMVLVEFSQSFPQTSPYFSYAFSNFSLKEYLKGK